MNTGPSAKTPIGQYYELDESLPSDRAEIEDKPVHNPSQAPRLVPEKQSFEFSQSPTTRAISPEAELNHTYALKVIRLNPGITPINFYCAIFHSFLGFFSMMMIGQIQPLILLDENYYNVSQDRIGGINTIIMMASVAVRILVSIPYGHFADKFGRKQMIIFGAANCLVGCLLVPFQKDVVPGFIIAKVIFFNGLYALYSAPLLADYIADESKGRATGFASMVISLAGIIANLIMKALLVTKVPLGTCYIVAGIFLFVTLTLNSLGLKGGDYYLTHKTRAQNQATQTVSVLTHMKEAFEVFKGNAWLRISLVLLILGASDFHMFFTFMTLYVKSLFPSSVPANTTNIMVNNIQTVVFVSSFSCKFFYGYFLDKPGKAVPLSLLALSGGIFAFLLTSLTTDPYEWTIWVAACLMGSTIPGLFVISNFLNIKNFPAEKRGIMIGFTGLVGSICFSILTSGGGFIYDHWRKDGPFLVSAGLLAIAILIVWKINRGIAKERVSDFWNKA